MRLQDPAKASEKLFEAANATASSTSKAVLGTLLVLGALWLTSLEPLIPQLNAVHEKAGLEKAILARLRKTQDSVRAKEMKALTGPDSIRLRKQLAGLSVREDTLKAMAKRAVKDRLDAMRNARITFALPAAPQFQVKVHLASLLWCVLALGLIVYWASKRRRVLWLAREACEYQVCAAATADVERPPIALQMPWWLAPLPRSPRPPTRDDYRVLFGWPALQWPRVVAVIGVLLAIVALQVRVTLIGAAAMLDLGLLPSLGWRAGVILSLSTVAILVAAFEVVRWVGPTHGGGDPATARETGRRSFLRVAGIAAATVVAAGVGKFGQRYPAVIVRVLRQPRFRRKRGTRTGVALESGFYLNTKSGVVHYVSNSRAKGSSLPHEVVGVTAHRRSTLKVTNLEPVSATPSFRRRRWVADGSTTSHRLNSAARPRAASEMGAHLEAAGHHADAIDLLQRAIDVDLDEIAFGRQRPQLRLYYQLAAIAIRANRRDVVQELIAEVNRSPRRAEFESAVRSWTDINGRWRKRLARRDMAHT